MNKETNIKIYIGDCRDVMKAIPDKSIDMVITSPPYNIGVDYGIYKDNITHTEYINLIDETVSEFKRILNDDGRIALNIAHVRKKESENKSFYLLDFLNIFYKHNFTVREIISWFKTKNEEGSIGTSTAWGSYLSASNPHLRGLVELIVVFNNNGRWKKESGTKVSDISKEEFMNYTRNAWFINSEKDRLHPAPFPIDIPLRLIKLYTYVGDTVLDPFCGSGTTLRACMYTNRNGIGIDLNPEYLNIMKKKGNIMKLGEKEFKFTDKSLFRSI